MFNIKDFLKGKKTVVEGPKKNPVGRPRKRPEKIEEAIKEEMPDIEEQLVAVAKPTKVAVEVEVSDSDLELVDAIQNVQLAVVEVESDSVSDGFPPISSSDSPVEREYTIDSDSDEAFFEDQQSKLMQEMLERTTKTS